MNLTELFMSPDPSNTALALVMLTQLSPVEVFEEFDKLHIKLRDVHHEYRVNSNLIYTNSITYKEARYRMKKEGLSIRYKKAVRVCNNVCYFSHDMYTCGEIVLIGDDYELKHFFLHSLPEDFMEQFKRHVLNE